MIYYLFKLGISENIKMIMLLIYTFVTAVIKGCYKNECNNSYRVSANL